MFEVDGEQDAPREFGLACLRIQRAPLFEEGVQITISSKRLTDLFLLLCFIVISINPFRILSNTGLEHVTFIMRLRVAHVVATFRARLDVNRHIRVRGGDL